MIRRLGVMSMGIGLLLWIGTGCAGIGNSRDLSPLDISTRFLPVPATVPPLDSLRHVQIQKGDERLQFDAESSFGELMRTWSSGYRVRRGPDLFEVGRMRSFATLWSREMRLVQFDQRTSIGAYPKEEAQREIAVRVDEPHAHSILIDVHVYIDRSRRSSYGITNLRNARWEIVLRTDTGTEIAPDSIDATWARPMTWSNSEQAHYRHNTLRFPRTTEGIPDVLQGVETLELYIRDATASVEFLFGWQFERNSER